MKKTVLPLTVLIATVALAGTAFAQDRAPRTRNATAPDTHFNFVEGSHVDGGTVGHAGIRTMLLTPSRRGTLVRPRVHFVPEMLRSVENI